MRYDRARTRLDRHATYIVATYIAGAARQLPERSLAAVSGQTASILETPPNDHQA